MFTRPLYDIFVKLAKWGQNMEMKYLGDHGPDAPLATPMVVE